MYYIIYGKVIRGNGYGKKIGYPTININRRFFLKMKKRPKYGVYTGRVFLGKKLYKAGIIIGPTDEKGLPKIEAHLIDFKGNAHGKKAMFEVGQFIRKFRKFRKEEELIKQIGKDLKKC